MAQTETFYYVSHSYLYLQQIEPLKIRRKKHFTLMLTFDRFKIFGLPQRRVVAGAASKLPRARAAYK
jgi:hypothetical protein